MSGLPGNPHYEASEAAQTEHGANVHALLAQTYEQRTENLIRLLENGYFELDDEEEVLKDIYQRVGKKL